jgi:hypothetical protein
MAIGSENFSRARWTRCDKDEMEVFFERAGPRLESNCPIHINFEDYSMDDLAKIMDIMMEKRGLIVEPDARIALLQEIEWESSKSPAEFSGARGVRNIVERVERIHAVRIDSAEVKAALASLGDRLDEKRALVQTITFSDTRKPPSSRAMGRYLSP